MLTHVEPRNESRFASHLEHLKDGETRRAYGQRVNTVSLSDHTGEKAIDSPTSEGMGHPEVDDPEFEVDVERTLAWQCLDAVRSRVAPLTYQAFDLYVLKGRAPKDVAKTLGIDTDAVYVAKSRVLSYARRAFEQLQSQTDEV